MRSASPPTTSSIRLTSTNCNVLTIATDCTLSHLPSFHLLLVQDIAAERWQFQNQDYWCVRKDGRTEDIVPAAGCVRACLQNGTQKSTPRCGFTYNWVQNARWMAVCVSFFVECRTEHSFLFCRQFQN